ncbi:MAG: hypothetical protein AAGN82_20320 [Myxococcota bacterium]
MKAAASRAPVVSFSLAPAVGAALLILSVGCSRDPPPWALPPAQDQPSDPARSAARAAPSTWLDVPWARSASAPSALPPRDVRPPRPGGLWASCADGFAPGHHDATPTADIARLGALCGPPTGLTPGGPVYAGELDAVRPARHDYEVKPRHCYRAFAVAPSSGTSALTARSGDGVLGQVDGTGGVLLLEPARPFCVRGTGGRITVELRGDDPGPYALQLWALAPSAE